MTDLKTFKQKLEEFKNGTLDTIAIHPEIMKTMRDEYYGMSKWQWFVEGFRNIHYILDCYETVEHFPDDFWESLSWGWMCSEIFPYDDPYNPYISPERKLRLGRW
jgi:Fe-S oxidoreductase